MMTKRPLVLPIASIVAAACATPELRSCNAAGPCLTTLSHSWFEVSAGDIAIAFVLATTVLAWLSRLTYVLHGVRHTVRALPPTSVPTALERAMKHSGIPDVACLATEAPLAFCVGILHPRIFVSSGLITQLQQREIEAVLLHEHHRRERRDPLRYAARRAAADVCFYLPIVDWWAHHQHENAEMGADRAALESVGHRPLAGALWATASSPAVPGAAFQGAAELRVAQVLGDPLPARRPESSILLASLAGILAAAAVTWCLAPVLALLV